MQRILSPAHITAGFVSVLVGYTSAAAIVLKAAEAGGADSAQAASWLWALGMGMGGLGILLSVRYRVPVGIAWSTPGAALLVTALSGVPMDQAVGAFLACAALIALVGALGWFGRLMALVPQTLAAAMLAGVLVRFGLDVFVALESRPALVGGMVATYVLGKAALPRYAVPLTLLVGVVLAVGLGLVGPLPPLLRPTVPVFVMPAWSLSALVGVALPLFVVTMASQNVPGVAVLRAHGYEVPTSPVMLGTGLTGLLLAPFGGFAFNLAAITAAICMAPSVDPDPSRRWMAAVWCGLFHILVGSFGASVVGLFGALPGELVSAIAGLALLTTIGASLRMALDDTDSLDAAVMTFAVTASGLTFLSIGSAFWGLALGLAVQALSRWLRGGKRA
ncbi:MAG: benzoate/H(+) symporter BenE family transporter [Rhodobacterales bacterium]|nr:benzoate/H(+) symporter BenE family transporter [Rhodobacterales bacterium]